MLYYQIEECYPKQIQLNESGTAFITINYLPQPLININSVLFDTLWNLHPKLKHTIVHNNKENAVYRYSQSYLQTPPIDDNYINKQHSYMYSGYDTEDNNNALPTEFEPYYNHMKSLDSKYNQVIANWYEDKDDYIAYHSDCVYNMIPNAKISLLSFYDCDKINEDNIRRLIIKPKPSTKSLYDNFEIILKHGMIITLEGTTNAEYRHGIKKEPIYKLPRISLSFRQMNNLVTN